jgi:hypothetical protein
MKQNQENARRKQKEAQQAGTKAAHFPNYRGSQHERYTSQGLADKTAQTDISESKGFVRQFFPGFIMSDNTYYV